MKKVKLFEEFMNEGKSFQFTFNYNTDEDDVEYIQNILMNAGVDAIAEPGIDSEEMVVKAPNAIELRKAKKVIQADGFEINESFVSESAMGDVYIMASDSDSFTAFRKEFMNENGKPKTVKELKALEAWLQTIWNERDMNEALSMDAVYIHQITGSGQDSAQNFIDDNNIDSAKLVAYLKRHKNSKEKYDVRDMISGINTNKRFIKQFVNESKEVFPNEIVGNDQILFKKEWEKMNGGKLAAKYNQYYKGYDIDAGGRIFNSVDQLEKYIKATVLSNNQYSKYRYMPEIPIAESTVNEAMKAKDYFKDPMNLADAKGWVRNLKLSDDEIKTKIKAVMKDPSKFNDLMDAMTDELNLKWK